MEHESILRNIRDIEAMTKLLDPDEETRTRYMDQTITYVNNFLKHLPDMQGYTKSKFEKLNALTISEEPKSMETLLEVLDEVDNGGINTASGRHLGFIPGGGLWASSVADMLAATTNRYAGVAYSNPGAVRIEHQLIEWLTSLVGYPTTAYGNLTSGGSIASLTAIKAARDHHGICSENVRKSVVYLTAHTHHCIHKALHTTGLHEAVIHQIPMTATFQMDTLALREAIQSDLAKGLRPFMVVATAGSTDTGAVDDMSAIADVCESHGMWMHVDAAYGGFFLLLDEMASTFKGIERSHSVVLDPHKSLFLPYGSGAVLVREREILLASNSLKASYMKDAADTLDVSPADTGIELSRHNRALRMWLPLHLHGLKPFRDALREKLALSKLFHQRIKELGFETGPTPDLSVSIFRLPEEDNSLNEQLVNELHADGTVFLSSTLLNGKLWIRCAILSHRTHAREIELALGMIERCKAHVISD